MMTPLFSVPEILLIFVLAFWAGYFAGILDGLRSRRQGYKPEPPQECPKIELPPPPPPSRIW